MSESALNGLTQSATFYIVGAGGHGRELAWLARRCLGNDRVIRFLVEPAFQTAQDVDGITVGTIDDEALSSGSQFIVAIGDPTTRERLALLVEANGARAATLIDPAAVVSPNAMLGAGSVVCAGAVLTTNIHVGRHVHINSGSLVHHDAIIGDFATLCPGVRIAGHVHIGSGVFIGIGATIINGNEGRPLQIGSGAVIAAGACVTGNVEAGALVAGVPAVRKR